MNKKVSKKTRKINYKSIFILIKILIIFIIVFGFYQANQTFENNISLLAVTENSKGIIQDGSIINLHLKVKPGNGQTYVNLNTINEIDTQISIINSQKIACNLFELDCQNYDFYYDFTGSALVLKGPSASSAIAILTAKTLRKEILSDDTVITGSLNSGGVMGNVGGVDEKIAVAESEGFKKVIIPVFSDYNQSYNHSIEVIKAIDLVEAYNAFNGIHYTPQKKEIDKSEYEILMKELSIKMCNRSTTLRDEINFDSILENSSLKPYKTQAKTSFNSSINANIKGNYYSVGSFCYNTNLNERVIIERQKNLTLDQINKNIDDLKLELQRKYVLLSSDEYTKNIETVNDFYVYLLILDRLQEARDFLDDATKLKLEYEKEEITNETSNKTIEIINKSSPTNMQDIINQKTNFYSFATERFYTVNLWEHFITHGGEKIKFDNSIINNACIKINREISIKSELLNNYGINFFNTEISKQQQFSSDFSNKYLCIYKGFELKGRINTVLNAVGINKDNQEEYTKKIMDLANERLVAKDNKNFPLIPYIYLEYSNDLFEQEDYSSAMLYSNFALSYGDINLYLEKEDMQYSTFNRNMKELFEMDIISLLFVVPLLVILGFL